MIRLRVSWIRRDMSCTGRQLFALMNIRRPFLARTANVLLQIILLTFKSSNNILSWQIMRDRFIDYEICQLRPVQLEKRTTRPVWQVPSNSWHPWPSCPYSRRRLSSAQLFKGWLAVTWVKCYSGCLSFFFLFKNIFSDTFLCFVTPNQEIIDKNN